MPEHERRKAQIARLLATVSVLGISVGMFRPAQAEDLTPSQQDKWMPTASAPNDTTSSEATGKSQIQPVPITGKNSAQLDAGSKDASQIKYDSVEGGQATDQLKLDTFSSGGDRPSDQYGGGGGAGKVSVTPGGAGYMKYDTNQGKLNAPDSADYMKYDVQQNKWMPEGAGVPAVQNKAVTPEFTFQKYAPADTTVPGTPSGPVQPK